jgi:hypothetical protein
MIGMSVNVLWTKRENREIRRIIFGKSVVKNIWHMNRDILKCWPRFHLLISFFKREMN